MSTPGVPVTVGATAQVGVERAFAVIAPIDLPRIFTGYGPLPAVVATRDQTGAWDHVGATRTVVLADRSTAQERLARFDAPHHFAYRLGPFSGSLRHLVSHAEGEWWFAAGPAGTTEIRWTYTFRPHRFRWLPVRLVAAPLWRRYATRALGLAVEAAQEPC